MQTRSISRLLLSMASLVIVVAGLKASAGFLGPILLSSFIVLVCSPIVGLLRRRKIPDWLIYTIIVFGVVALGLMLVGFLALSIRQLIAALPTYRLLLENQIQSLNQWLDSLGIQGADILKLDLIAPSRLIQPLIGFLGELLNTLANVGLTLIIFIYMLVGASNLSKKLNKGLGVNNPLLDRIRIFTRSISVYLLIKTWLGGMAAIGQTLLLLFLGVDFAILWGVISFLFNYIPNIGYFIALVPPVLIALLEFGLGKATIVFIGYAIINNFFDIVIGPRYLGKGLNLSTLVTFLAVIIWAWILGPIGTFLALPLTVAIKKLILETHRDSQLFAKLIDVEDEETTVK